MFSKGQRLDTIPNETSCRVGLFTFRTSCNAPLSVQHLKKLSVVVHAHTDLSALIVRLPQTSPPKPFLFCKSTNSTREFKQQNGQFEALLIKMGGLAWTAVALKVPYFTTTNNWNWKEVPLKNGKSSSKLVLKHCTFCHVICSGSA